MLVLIAALSGGAVLLLRQSSTPGVEILLPTATPEPGLKVYLSGAVRNPGVYVIREGDRLAQAIEVAGGPTEDADLERVNLALRVHDEDHWHIPRVGEALLVPDATVAPGRLGINTATAERLQTLPGIGQVKAQAIVSYREANGDFLTVEDLLKVPGIGPTILEAIRELITVR